MPAATKRKTSLTLNAATLDAARDLGINVSSIAEEALQSAVAKARRSRWIEDNAAGFAAQADWHECNGHPLSEIIASAAGESWKV